MVQIKGIRSQERIPTSQSHSPTTKAAWIGKKHRKSPPKMSYFALAGDPTAVTLATNYSIFIKCPLSTVTRAQERFPTSQSGSPTTKVAWIGQKHPNSPLKHHVPLCQGTWYMFRYDPKYVITAQEGISVTQSCSATTKMAWICQKTLKITPKLARSILSGDPTDVSLVINHSIFIKRP